MVTPEVMKHIRDSMNDMRKTIRKLETQSAHNKASAETTSLTFGEKEKRLSELEDYIDRIHSARGWKALTLYYRMKDRFLGMIRSIRIMPV
jgi:signal transduction histidine kinase